MLKTVKISNKLSIFCDEIITILYNTYKKEIEKKGFYTLVLTGGNTPLPIYDRLAKEKSIDWKKVFLFWADERCVSQSDRNNNYYNALQHFIKYHDFGGVFPINTKLPPEEAAIDYNNIIKSFFEKHKIDNFDTVLLGMGLDGHVASIFEPNKQYDEDVVNTSAVDFERVSMTLQFINTIKEKVLMLKGEEKFNVLNNNEKNLPKDKIKFNTVVYFDDTIQ